jgi:hypothetical protein
LTHTPEQQSPFAEHSLLVDLQQLPLWQMPEQQSVLALQASGTSLQHALLRQSSPETQSVELSHVPPSGTGSARQTPPTQIPEQQCALLGQELPLGLQQTPSAQIDPEQQLLLGPQELLLGLQHAPSTQLPEQHWALAVQDCGTSLQHCPLRQSSGEAQSGVSSQVPPTTTGPEAQTPLTQMSEQHWVLLAQAPPVARQQALFWQV